MAELHDALTYLAPVDWNDVPKDDLEAYLADCFAAGELICNSVPSSPDGTPFEVSKPQHSTPNSAKSHKEIHASAARAPSPHEAHSALRKNWGKPMKFNQRNNPLKTSLYKMAGNDRHGAWFARRTVTEGLGFDKFKRAMMREFPESMIVDGGPGAGAVRGIAADRRLERIDVPGVGKLEVYELSAQFPGPVTPRDFVTLLLSTDDGLSEKSGAEVGRGKKHVPRHFMVVSKPVQHPDAPIRSGYVRGQYESVELIREIPLSSRKSKSTTDLLTKSEGSSKNRERGYTIGFAESRGVDARGEQTDLPNNEEHTSEAADDPELCPVEWTMITRSDPGGGIPRFLVERGTPETMIQDVHKFFDWACSQDHIPHPDDDIEKQEAVSSGEAELQNHPDGASVALHDASDGTAEAHKDVSFPPPNRAATSPSPATGSQTQQGGILNAIEAGINAYAPTAVSSLVNSRLHPEEEFSDDSSDTSSIDSFMSAEEITRSSTAPEIRPVDSVDTLSIASGEHSDSSKYGRPLSPHEKEIQKLTKKREKLEQQLAKKRMAEEQKLREAQEKEQTESDKTKEKIERDLKKTEEKHRKEIEKLEAKKVKEARKAEDKRRKKDEQSKLSLVSRERDEFRSQADLYRREGSLLREQIAELQSQNTQLTQLVGKIGGQEALKSIDWSHKRSVSIRSSESSRSLDQKGDASGSVS